MTNDEQLKWDQALDAARRAKRNNGKPYGQAVDAVNFQKMLATNGIASLTFTYIAAPVLGALALIPLFFMCGGPQAAIGWLLIAGGLLVVGLLPYAGLFRQARTQKSVANLPFLYALGMALFVGSIAAKIPVIFSLLFMILTAAGLRSKPKFKADAKENGTSFYALEAWLMLCMVPAIAFTHSVGYEEFHGGSYLAFIEVSVLTFAVLELLQFYFVMQSAITIYALYRKNVGTILEFTGIKSTRKNLDFAMSQLGATGIQSGMKDAEITKKESDFGIETSFVMQIKKGNFLNFIAHFGFAIIAPLALLAVVNSLSVLANLTATKANNIREGDERPADVVEAESTGMNDVKKV